MEKAAWARLEPAANVLVLPWAISPPSSRANIIDLTSTTNGAERRLSNQVLCSLYMYYQVTMLVVGTGTFMGELVHVVVRLNSASRPGGGMWVLWPPFVMSTPQPILLHQLRRHINILMPHQFFIQEWPPFSNLVWYTGKHYAFNWVTSTR